MKIRWRRHQMYLVFIEDKAKKFKSDKELWTAVRKAIEKIDGLVVEEITSKILKSGK